MKYASFGKTGFALSKLGVGTVQFGIDYGYTKKKTQDEVNKILAFAQQNKINYLDTANEYGDSEKKIGQFMQSHQSDFIVFTKLKKITPLQCQTPDSVRLAILNSLSESLHNLGQASLDFVLIHQSDEYILSCPFIFACLDDFRKQGLIKGFGVSVYTPEEIEYLLANNQIFVDFFQIPYNIFDRRFNNIINRLNELDIGIICRSIFLKGMIICDSHMVPSELSALLPYKDALNRLAKSLHLNTAELALLYVISDERISSAIIGVDTPEELMENVKILDKNISIDRDRIEYEMLKIREVQLIDPRKWPAF